jgi:hypothetical protein
MMLLHIDLRYIVHLYLLPTRIMHVCQIHLYVYHLVFILKIKLVFKLCNAIQEYMFTNLFLNLIKKFQKKSLHLIPF